jgi:hypothetical protein
VDLYRAVQITVNIVYTRKFRIGSEAKNIIWVKNPVLHNIEIK